jgi:predicted nucleic acid-binding protein
LTIYRKPYIESSVFIAFIKGETQKGNHDCEKVVGSILEAAKRGLFQIFTSSLTIAEVFKNKKSIGLTEQQNADLRPYFREAYIQLIEVDRAIGERANELCRTHQRSLDIPALRPNDAIHLASAERAGCEVLLAYDPDLTKQSHESLDIRWPEEIVQIAPPPLLWSPDEPLLQEALALSDGLENGAISLMLPEATETKEPEPEK